MNTQLSIRPLLSIAVFVLPVILSPALWAKTHYVEIWGSDANSCTRTAPCLSIDTTVFKARKNDRIVVGPGVYDENLLIETNSNVEPLEGLKLESTAGRYGTIIRNPNPIFSVITIRQPRVRIGKKGKGFTLEGATNAYGIEILTSNAKGCKIEGNRINNNRHGFFLLGAEKVQVRNNIIRENTGYGLYCASCDKALIRGNQILENGFNGIIIANSYKMIIERNVVSGHDSEGIYHLDTSNSGTIRNNVSELSASEDGFRIGEADGMLIQGNISARNGDGLDDRGFAIFQSDLNKSPSINNNLALGNAYEGIYLVHLSNMKVDANTALQNGTDGIELFPSGTSISSLKSNNTFDNGAGCGITNGSGMLLNYSKHFFGGGDGGCGLLNGSTATRPSPLKVRVAAGL